MRAPSRRTLPVRRPGKLEVSSIAPLRSTSRSRSTSSVAVDTRTAGSRLGKRRVAVARTARSESRSSRSSVCSFASLVRRASWFLTTTPMAAASASTAPEGTPEDAPGGRGDADAPVALVADQQPWHDPHQEAGCHRAGHQQQDGPQPLPPAQPSRPVLGFGLSSGGPHDSARTTRWSTSLTLAQHVEARAEAQHPGAVGVDERVLGGQLHQRADRVGQRSSSASMTVCPTRPRSAAVRPFSRAPMVSAAVAALNGPLLLTDGTDLGAAGPACWSAAGSRAP